MNLVIPMTPSSLRQQAKLSPENPDEAIVYPQSPSMKPKKTDYEVFDSTKARLGHNRPLITLKSGFIT